VRSDPLKFCADIVDGIVSESPEAGIHSERSCCVSVLFRRYLFYSKFTPAVLAPGEPLTPLPRPCYRHMFAFHGD